MRPRVRDEARAPQRLLFGGRLLRLHPLLAYAAGVASVALVGLGVVESGVYDAGATSPHGPVAYWVLRTTMERSVRRRAAAIAAPPRFTPEQTQAGFRLYEADCVMCHGAPGVGQAPFVGRMTPPPPYLLEASRDWSPSELYFIVRHGVKMTAMPAWEGRLDERQTWEVVAFLEALPKLDRPAYLRLKAGQGAPRGLR